MVKSGQFTLTINRWKARAFLKAFAGYSVKEISWTMLCDDNINRKINRSCIALLIVMLENGTYQAHDKNDMLRLLPVLKKHLPILRTEWSLFFKISEAHDIYCKEKNGGVTMSLYLMTHCTGYLRKCITDFLDSPFEVIFPVDIIQSFCDSFAESLGKIISNYTDFTDSTFWNQVDFYKTLESKRLVYTQVLIQFYRLLFRLHPDYVFFEGSDNINASFFSNDRIFNFIRDEYVSADRTFLFKISTSVNEHIYFASLPYENLSLLGLVKDYQKSRSKVWHYMDYSEFLYHFEDSLDRFRDIVNGYADFNENTFWEQIGYFKSIYNGKNIKQKNSITFVCFFYRYLVNTYIEHAYFEDGFTMTKSLLFNRQLVGKIISDYKFIFYNPYDKIPDAKKYVITLRGFDKYSTRIASDDFFSIDLSPVTERKYRSLIMQYMFSSTSVLIELHGHHCSIFKEMLSKITQMKKKKGYPNPDLFLFTNQEAVLIRNFIYDPNRSLATHNNKIGSMRRFFQWAKESGYMKFDDMFFGYLRQFEEPAITTAKPVPDKDLIAINSLLVKKAHEEHVYLLAYTIFHLLIQTEFRISQICKLEIGCIQPSVKPSQYRIVSGSKSSHGAKVSYIITDMTYHLLMNIIDTTESYREKCSIDTYKNYIFLYDGSMTSVIPFKNDKFSTCMETCCKELGFDSTYSAKNIRDTHMTKAFEHILHTGKSDFEMGVLSKHKHLDTTKSHYIEIELEKMLEATYGITIGYEKYIDTVFKVVDEIPDDAQGPDSDVQERCGKCISSECVFKSLLPCMVCKYFVTTEKHEHFFKKAIEHIDGQIAVTNNRHDIEALTLIKTLYVLYLEAIYKHKEGISL